MRDDEYPDPDDGVGATPTPRPSYKDPFEPFSPNLELILGAMRLRGEEPDQHLLARLLERMPLIEPHLDQLYETARRQPDKPGVFEEVSIFVDGRRHVVRIPSDEVGYHHFAQGERV